MEADKTHIETVEHYLSKPPAEVARLTAELETAQANVANSPNIEKLQQTVEELAGRIEITNMRSQISNRVSQQLAYQIRFIALGAILMANINLAAVYEDLASRLTVGIT